MRTTVPDSTNGSEQDQVDNRDIGNVGKEMTRTDVHVTAEMDQRIEESTSGALLEVPAQPPTDANSYPQVPGTVTASTMTASDYHPLLNSPSKAPDFQTTEYGSVDLSFLSADSFLPKSHQIHQQQQQQNHQQQQQQQYTSLLPPMNRINTHTNSNTSTNANTTLLYPTATKTSGAALLPRPPLSSSIQKQKSSPPKQHTRGTSEFSFFARFRRNNHNHNLAAENTYQALGPATGHHRRLSSISRLMESLGDGLTHGWGSIIENVQGSARDVKRSWHEEMQHANDGKFRFLDTSLMTNLSILPEDMELWAARRRLKEQMQQHQHQHLHQHHRVHSHQLYTQQEHEDDDEEERSNDEEEAILTDFEDHEQKPSTIGIGPYIALLGAVLAVSSNGTALTLQTKIPPALKLYWRMVGTSIVLFPFAMNLLWKEGFPKLNVAQWVTMGLAVACYVIHNLCFIEALSFTSIGNAVLFTNTQALILLAGKALTGVEIESVEYLGAIVAFSGAVMCATDTERVALVGNGNGAAFGDLLAMVAAVFGVGYLTFAKAVRPATSVVIFMFLVMSLGSCLVLLFMTIIDVHFTADLDPYHGLFGWMSLRHDRLPLELWIVLVCNIVGTMGFVRSMQYFDSIIIAISTLLEPMVASVIAASLQVGVLPGPQGWLGNVLVVIGTFGVVYPSASKGDSQGH